MNYIITIIISFSVASVVFGQPSSFTLSDASSGSISNYENSGFVREEAICYINVNNGSTGIDTTLEFDGNRWIMGIYLPALPNMIPCDDNPNITNLFSSSNTTNIAEADIDGAGFTNASIIDTSPSLIPTLGEWALLILSVLLCIIGLVAMINKNVLINRYSHHRE